MFEKCNYKKEEKIVCLEKGVFVNSSGIIEQGAEFNYQPHHQVEGR